MSVDSGTQNKRILIVEDEPSLRMGFQMSLSSVGFDVDTSANGLEAYESIVEEGVSYDLAITDLRMPGMCGAELIDKVKGSGVYLPWITVSAWFDLPKVVQLVSCGVADFLKKPVTPDELRAAIDQTFESEETYGDFGGAPEEENELKSWIHSRVRRRDWGRLKEVVPTFFDSKRSDATALNIWDMIVSCVRARDGKIDPSDPSLTSDPLFAEKDWFSVLALNA